MGTFDWNNDGKTDATDDFLFLEVISKDSETDDDQEDSFPTLRSSSSYSRTSSQPSSHPTYHHRNNSVQIGGLTKLAIGLTIFLCISALFMGYAHIIGDLLGLGVLVCFFTNWLEN